MHREHPALDHLLGDLGFGGLGQAGFFSQLGFVLLTLGLDRDVLALSVLLLKRGENRGGSSGVGTFTATLPRARHQLETEENRGRQQEGGQDV